MINKESYMPYYLQIYNELKDKIDTLVYKPGELLPSENELVERYKVTRSTVRSALNKLKENGIIYTEKGKGSFVNSPKVVQELNSIYTFGKEFYESGYKVENEIIDRYSVQCSSFLQNILKLKDKDIVQIIKLVKKLDGVPIVAQTMYLPAKVLPDISFLDMKIESIYKFLEVKYGIHVLRAREYIDPIIADESQAEILEVEFNTPLLFTERITYAEGDIPVEYRECVIRNDKVRFSVDLYK